MTPREMFSLIAMAFVCASHARAANNIPEFCAKWLNDGPVFESLVSDFNPMTIVKARGLNTLEVTLDASPLPPGKEYQNNVHALSERVDGRNVIDRVDNLVRTIHSDPANVLVRKFRQDGTLFIFVARTKANGEDAAAATRRLERVLNLGLRGVTGSAEISFEAEPAFFSALLSEASSFLAAHGISHTVRTRVPNVKEPRIEDFYISIINGREGVTMKYDPIEAYKNLVFARKAAEDSVPKPKSKPKPKPVPQLTREQTIKLVNEALEKSVLRVVEMKKDEVKKSGPDSILYHSLQVYRAGALQVTVERLPEVVAYDFNGRTVQPGHFVLRFHDKSTGKTDFRIISAEKMKGL